MINNTYALIKDGVVVNNVAIDDLTDDVLELLHEAWGSTEAILIPSSDLWFVTIGSLWDGNDFTAVQGSPYPSWIWDKTKKTWKAPVNMPDTDEMFDWDESMLEWIQATD
jgi:hypothetical protein